MTATQTAKATLSYEGKTAELPVLTGTLGPAVADIRKINAELGIFTFDPAYGATAACESAITFIDGDEGVLLHRGYPIDQLAEQSSFMEVAYLLLNGELPSKDEFASFNNHITRHTMVHEQLSAFFREIGRAHV